MPGHSCIEIYLASDLYVFTLAEPLANLGITNFEVVTDLDMRRKYLVADMNGYTGGSSLRPILNVPGVVAVRPTSRADR